MRISSLLLVLSLYVALWYTNAFVVWMFNFRSPWYPVPSKGVRKVQDVLGEDMSFG